jgi:hypothetical protein
MLPWAAAVATPAAKRTPIERFEFAEVLNLKGKTQIGRSKAVGWADNLANDFEPSAPVTRDTKAATSQARKSSAERRSTKTAR